MEEGPQGPLAGIKVVECTNWAFGPLAGAMLGDLGADVIKVENPPPPTRRGPCSTSPASTAPSRTAPALSSRS